MGRKSKKKSRGKRDHGRNLPVDEAVPNLVQPSPQAKVLRAIFYRSEAGGEPVRNWLKGKLGKDDRFRIGVDIKKVEFGWPIGLPTCRPLTKGLWEVRTDLSSNTTARIIFFVYDGAMVLLHGFIKKTQQTPQSDIDVALKRKRKVEK
jgi:phage-related protein